MAITEVNYYYKYQRIDKEGRGEAPLTKKIF